MRKQTQLLISIFLVVIVAVLSGCSTKQNIKDGTTTLLAGEKAICDYYGGEYAVSMNKATIGTQYNQFHDTQPERILIIDYSYENISSDTDVTFSFLYMRVYDGEGNLLETYPSIETKQSQGLVSKGHHTSASTAYSLNSSSNEITIDVYDPVFNKFGTFKLTIEE